MCVCVCVCEREREREREKELTHSIVEAGESQDLEGELASWRPRRASGLALVQLRGLRTKPTELIFQFGSLGRKRR